MNENGKKLCLSVCPKRATDKEYLLPTLNRNINIHLKIQKTRYRFVMIIS